MERCPVPVSSRPICPDQVRSHGQDWVVGGSEARADATEVGVGRDDHPRFERGPLEDSFVAGGLHAVVEDVDGVVAGGAESLRHPRREGIVDDEVHASRGIIRSRTASAA